MQERLRHLVFTVCNYTMYVYVCTIPLTSFPGQCMSSMIFVWQSSLSIPSVHIKRITFSAPCFHQWFFFSWCVWPDYRVGQCWPGQTGPCSASFDHNRPFKSSQTRSLCGDFGWKTETLVMNPKHTETHTHTHLLSAVWLWRQFKAQSYP